MGVPRFVFRLLRQAPDKRQLIRSLALGSTGGNRTVNSTDGTELAVRHTGEGDPMVLVHGSLDGIGAFSLVELRLADDYSVWAYDRRGRGGSADGPEYSLDREVEDLRSVVAATGGVPHVVAHSFGAVIALQGRLAGVPMRSLTAYEPPINGDTIDPEQIADLRLAVGEGRLDDAIRAMGHGIAGLTGDEVATAMKVPPVRKSLRDGVRVVVREIEAVQGCEWSTLAVTGVPTLVLRGERSRAAVYPRHEQDSELAPNGERAVLADQGHLAHVFAPTAFGDAVLEFVGRH